MIRVVSFDDATHCIVPIVPTNEMNKAGYEAEDIWDRAKCDNQKELAYSFSVPRWRAMIAAAPKF